MRSVQAEQQQTAQPLIQRMAEIAYGCLRYLGDESLSKAQQQVQHGAAPVERLHQYSRVEPNHLAIALHDGTAGR